MWSKMTEASLSYAPLTDADMADLFALLYYLSVLDPVGNPDRALALL
jgi:hypothetical protein